MSELQNAIEYHRQGDLDEAKRRYEGVLKSEPEHADAMHLLGVIALQRGETSEAESLIQRALKTRPDSGAYTCSLGNLRRAQGRLDEARSCYEQSVDLDPNLADGYNNLGLLMISDGDAAGAETNFKMALVVNPDDGPTLNNMGYALLQQDKADEAVAYLMRAVQATPRSALAQANLGSAMRANGTAGLAVRCFENAIGIRPDFERAHVELGEVLVELHQTEEGKREFEKAVEINPQNAGARLGLARMLREEGEIEDAVEHLEAALADPDGAALVVGELAQAYLDVGRFYPSAESARAWLRLEPDNTQAHFTLGRALAGAGEYEQAREAMIKAATLDPDSAEAHALAALAQEQGGHIADSELAAHRALNLEPGHAAASGVKARNALRAGRLPQALELLEAALAGDAQGFERIDLEDALALTLEAHNDAVGAVEAAARARALRAQTPGAVFPSQPKPELLAQYAALQTPERLQAWPQAPLDDGRPSPVFLFAAPGAGLEVVAQALARHPGLAVLDDRFKPSFERGDVFTRQHAFDKLHELDETDLHMHRRQYWRGVKRLLEGNWGERVAVDVLPTEQSLLDVAYRIFPEARLIWLQRDPRDALVDRLIGPHDGPLANAAYLEPMYAAAYLGAVCRVFHAFGTALPDRVTRLRYEALGNDLDAALEPLYQSCGVDPDSAVNKSLSRLQAYALPPRPFSDKAAQRHSLYADDLADALGVVQEAARVLEYS